MKDTMKAKDARLAFREEGQFWVCYLAEAGSMEGAFAIGSILLRPIEENEELKRRFKELMQDTLTFVFAEALGITVERFEPEVPAPDKDRTKPT